MLYIVLKIIRLIFVKITINNSYNNWYVLLYNMFENENFIYIICYMYTHWNITIYK